MKFIIVVLSILILLLITMYLCILDKYNKLDNELERL